MTTYNFGGIGTLWQIDISQELSPSQESGLFTRIKERVEVFEKTYSRFRSDSLVAKIANESGIFELPPDAHKLFSFYYDLYKKTDGFFTPFMGGVLSDAGYDAQYSLKQKKALEIPPLWEDVFEYKHPTLVVKKPAALDFGAAGKGYLIDLVAQVIEEHSITSYCIDAGGDILYRGETPIRIGLEHPQDTEKVLGVYMLEGGSICGSAGNRRTWGDFTHIINPKTLVSPKDIIAVWVIAETAFLADALATCLFFVNPAILEKTYDFEYAIVFKDLSIQTSSNFKGELFTS